MTITSVDQLLAAMTASDRERKQISKATVTTASGGSGSFWRSSGFPVAGASPTAAATCNNTTQGGFNYTLPTGGKSAYLARLNLTTSTINSVEVHDRLAHMGGLNGTLTTAQTVGVDLNALAATDNIAVRKGPADYSSVQWWFEWYASTGGTGVNATISYTDQNGTSGKTVVIAIPATVVSGRMIQILPNAGDNIRSIESVTLSVTTGTAGNFGITATVEKVTVPVPQINLTFAFDWAALSLPTIPDSACLFMIGDATTTTTGAIGGSLLIAKG